MYTENTVCCLGDTGQGIPLLDFRKSESVEIQVGIYEVLSLLQHLGRWLTETHLEDAANLMSIVCQTSHLLLPEEKIKIKKEKT